MAKGSKKYKFRTLADFIKAAWDNQIPLEDVENILQNIRYGVGLNKRDRELARLMQTGPNDFESDPLFQRGLAAGYLTAQDDVRNGVDILAVGADQISGPDQN